MTNHIRIDEHTIIDTDDIAFTTIRIEDIENAMGKHVYLDIGFKSNPTSLFNYSVHSLAEAHAIQDKILNAR